MTDSDLAALLAAAPDDPFARREHYAHSGQLFGWMTSGNQAHLIQWLPTVAKGYPHHPMRIVEVGTFAGSTARGLIVLTGGGRVTCVDNFSDLNEKTLNGHPNGRSYWEWTVGQSPDLRAYATLIEGDSAEVGRAWAGGPVDLLLVDGNHSYQGALADLRAWGGHVALGGYLLVDDHHMPDVALAVAAYRDPDAWEVLRVASGEHDTLFVAQRKAAA